MALTTCLDRHREVSTEAVARPGGADSGVPECGLTRSWKPTRRSAEVNEDEYRTSWAPLMRFMPKSSDKPG
jgi:hypothetical protein